jgi:syntaxin 16
MELSRIGLFVDKTEQYFESRKGRAGRFKNDNDIFGSHSNSSDNGAESLLDGMPKSDNKVEIEMTTELKSAPDWFKLFEQIYEEEANISRRMADLKSSQEARLRPSFEESEIAKLDKTLKELRLELSNGLKNAEGKIKELQNYSIPSENSAYLHIKDNMKSMLANKLQKLTAELRKCTKEHLEKRKHLDPSAREEAKQVKQVDPTNVQEMVRIEAQTQYKDEEINQLVRSMNDIANIFKELSVIVIEQGNILDRIDYNLEATLTNVQKGNKQLVTVNV